MADPPPQHFIPRPAEFDALIRRLMADGINNVAITAALRGAGGYGKTTLAKAICHDPRIQAAFPDGTLWTTLGQPKFDLPDLPHPALIRTLEGHSFSVSGCAFSPDGKLIVSASYDRTLKVWDSETGQSLRTLDGHSSSVNGCAFSPDGKLIVSTSVDGALKVWDSGTGQTLATFFADGPMLCCVVYGEMIAAGGARGVYFLWLAQ